MKKQSYFEQLRHPNWQRKRLEVMEARGFKCETCGDTDTTLNVHHKRYVKGRSPWEYSNQELEVLCEPCHESAHHAKERVEEIIASASSLDYAEIATILAAYFGPLGRIDPGRLEEHRQNNPDLYFAVTMATEFEYHLADLERVVKDMWPKLRPFVRREFEAWQEGVDRRGDEAEK